MVTSLLTTFTDISAEVKNKHILLAGIVISFMEFLNPIKKVVNPINIS